VIPAAFNRAEELIAARARAVFDDERLAQTQRQLLETWTPRVRFNGERRQTMGRSYVQPWYSA
jgi:hypothetical protein